jgi:hypothetical protein
VKVTQRQKAAQMLPLLPGLSSILLLLMTRLLTQKQGRQLTHSLRQQQDRTRLPLRLLLLLLTARHQPSSEVGVALLLARQAGQQRLHLQPPLLVALAQAANGGAVRQQQQQLRRLQLSSSSIKWRQMCHQ